MFGPMGYQSVARQCRRFMGRKKSSTTSIAFTFRGSVCNFFVTEGVDVALAKLGRSVLSQLSIRLGTSSKGPCHLAAALSRSVHTGLQVDISSGVSYELGTSDCCFMTTCPGCLEILVWS